MIYKTHLRRELRKTATPAERLLWSRLRGKQMGCKFRRQHSIGNYIVDFYCAEERLIVEVDGGIHNQPEIKGQDRFRDEFCAEFGCRILRVSNEDVHANLDGMCELIRSFCAYPTTALPAECGVGEN
jgi:very-short-patch-repair endonuclease